MEEAQWPKDTASPSMIEATLPIKWVEHNGENSSILSALPSQADRQVGSDFQVNCPRATTNWYKDPGSCPREKYPLGHQDPVPG